MSIWRHMTVNSTGEYRIDQFRPVSCRLDMESSGEIRPGSMDKNERWVMQATVRVDFWANRAQLQTARSIALRAIAAKMYHDELGQLHQLRVAIMDGNADAAMLLVSKMERSMTDAEGRAEEEG